MNLESNIKINTKGKLGIYYSSNTKKYYTVGQDRTTKIISQNQQNFEIQKFEDNDSEYFFIKKFDEEKILLIGGNLNNKGVIKKLDEDLKILEEIFSCENEILEICENKGILFCLLKNGIQVFSISEKKSFFYEEENIKRILKLDNEVFIVVGEKLEKLVFKENEFDIEKKIFLELKNDFDNFLIFKNNLVCSKNEKLFVVNFLKKEVNEIENLTDSETIESLLYVKNNEILIFSNKTLFWVDIKEKKNIAFLEYKNKPLFLLENEDNFVLVDKSGNMNIIKFDRSIQIKRKKMIIDEEEYKEENQDDVNIEAALADFDILKEKEKNVEINLKKMEVENEPKKTEEVQNNKKLTEINLEKQEKTEKTEEEKLILDKDFIVDDLNPQPVEKKDVEFNQKKKTTDLLEFMGHYPNEIINSGSVDTKLRRIIKTNQTGTITSYLEPELNNIEIEFSDHDLHSKILMENTDNIMFGDLNEKGFILASYGKEINEDEYEEEEQEDKDELAKLIFKSITNDNEWTIEYPIGINIEFISLSCKYIYVVDNSYNIRCYSFGGIEIMNFSLGSIICVSSFEHLLAVVQQKSLPIFGRQNLVMTIFNIHTMEKIIEMDLVLSPFSTLRWFGFSDEGIIYTQDSEGYIRMQVYNNYWITLHRPKSQRNFWLFGVMDKELIGYRLMVGEKSPDVFKKYSVFRLMPKCETFSVNENNLNEEGDLIYSTADFLNEKYRYEQFKHIKHTITKNVLVNIFKEKILTPDERLEKELQIELKKVEFIRKLLCEGREQAALFQTFQLKKEEHFQLVIKLFEKLKFKKLADQLKDMAKENGFMMILSTNNYQNNVQRTEESQNYKRVESEKFNKYFEDNKNEEKKKDFFMEERDKLMNVEDEPSSYVESNKQSISNVNKRQKKVIDNDLFGALGSLKQNKRFK